MVKDVEVAERGSYSAKDYHDPPLAPLIDAEELGKWSFYRAVIAAFIATLLFLYITVLTDTVIGYKSQSNTNAGGDACGRVRILGVAWAFVGMIFILVYCTARISGADSGVSVVVVIMFIVLVASPELGAARLLPAEFWSTQHRILLPSLQRGTTPASPDPTHTKP